MIILQILKHIKRHMNVTSTLTMVLLFSTLCVTGVSSKKYRVVRTKEGLYDHNTDDVFSLSNDTFKYEVMESEPGRFWVVEFYNSWCGHCINFAPHWKTVASNFKEWQDILPIAAVDCAQSEYMATCRMWGVQKYPTMRLFPPSKVANRSALVETMNEQSPSKITPILYNFVLKYAPLKWNLKPLQKVEDIWASKLPSHEFVFIVFTKKTSYLGMEVVLDLRHSPNTLVRFMYKEQIEKFGIINFPCLYKVLPDSTYKLVTLGNKDKSQDRTTFVNLIKKLTGAGEETDNSKPLLPQKAVKSVVKSVEKVEEKVAENEVKNVEAVEVYVPKKPNPNSTVVSMQDLESALHYSFRQEVAICQVIEGDRLEALRAFVKVLLKYFPGRPQILGFLKKVFDVLAALPSSGLTGEAWVDKLDQIQDADSFLPSKIRWGSCAGSSPRYRGYPCAMWTLFHTLTVGQFAQSKFSRSSSPPSEVLQSVRGYMGKFFGCEECSKNFQEEAANVETEIKSAHESVLWLWSTHNRVNKRLHTDISEDPLHLKVQFPSPALCRTCYKSLVIGGGQISWDLEKVLHFLVKFYGRDNIKMSEAIGDGKHVNADVKEKEDLGVNDDIEELDWWETKQKGKDLEHIKDLQARKGKKLDVPDSAKPDTQGRVEFGQDGDIVKRGGDEGGMFQRLGKVEQPTQGWGVTHLDLSMCMVFYVASTIIIFLLYHHFIMRRSNSLCKSIRKKSRSSSSSY